MADHQITSRLWNLWSGFVSLWVQKKENENPEIAYKNSIASMTTKYVRLKQAAGRVILRQEDIKERVGTAEKELAQVLADLSAAVATQQDELALVLIEKKNRLTTNLASMRPELETADGEAQQMTNQLLEVQGEIANLKAEKDVMVGRFHSAEARLQIQSSLDGLSLDAEVQALEGVRAHIKGKVAEANLGATLRSNDLDVRLKTLRRTTGSVTARAELDAMKAAHAAASTQAVGGKTL